MEKDLISVIIPVYNAGTFLTPCLDSLMEQTYRNLEILLIDDGSTDGSGEICDKYAANDNRFKVIHKENGGISSARNVGLDIAKGEYVAFIDSDDWVLSDYFEILYRDIVENGADISSCGYAKVDELGNLIPKEPQRFLEKRCVSSLDVLLADVTKYGIVWCNLLSKSLIGNYRFSELRCGEDSLFMFDLLCKNPRASQNPYVGYFYVQNSMSVTHTKTISNLLKDKDRLTVHAHRYINIPTSSPEIRNELLMCYAKHFHLVAYLAAQRVNKEHCVEIRIFLKKHLKFLLPHQKEIPRKLRMYIMLYAMSPWLYDILVRAKRELRGKYS